jgi:hypothetical protein
VSVRVKVQHIGRDADNLGHLLDKIVFGRIAVLVFDRIQMRGVDRTAVFPVSIARQAPSV